MQQRLVAILAADVVGYSRLMAQNQNQTLDALREIRTELFGKLVDAHRGSVIKSMGDGWLVEFDSATNAVSCGIAIQNNLAGHDIIKLRIGIHIGDVMHEDEDIFGDGVNIAARLEAIASPGGITLSDAVRSSLDGTLTAAFKDAGVQTLKNIEEPVRVWTHGTTGLAVESSLTRSQRHRPAIAVVPFDNMSADPDQEFLSDGLVEDIITALSQFDSLLVIARGSTSVYKGNPKPPADIARELDVNYVVKGSVRRAGERLRVAVQLIDGETGGSVRAERFDRTMADLFDLQDELTLAIVAAVAPEITHREIARVRHSPTTSLTAWELYQRALGEFYTFSQESVDVATALAISATEADPGMAAPCALLARIYGTAHLKIASKDSDDNLKHAMHWARRAIACDNRSDEAHGALGFAFNLSGRAQDAMESLERAIEINANNGTTRLHLAMVYTLPDIERSAEALEHVQMALKISPTDPFGWAWTGVASIACLQLGQYAEAARYYARCRRHDHHDWKMHLVGAICDVVNNDLDAAADMLNKAQRCAAPQQLSLDMARRSLPHVFSFPRLEFACDKLVELGLSDLSNDR